MGKGSTKEGWMESSLRKLKARMAGPVSQAHWKGVNTFRDRFKRVTKSSREARKAKRSGIKQGRVMNEGTGGQYSRYDGPRGKSFLPKHVEDALSPLSFVTASALQLKSTVGAQNVVTALGLMGPSLSTNVFSDKITRVIYERATGDVTINNVQLSNAYIIIYDVMSRKDLAAGSAVGSPTAAWSQGDTDIGPSTAYQVLGSTPWQSEAFNQFFEVKQVTNVVLCAGGTHVHKVRLSPKKIVSASYGQYSGAQFRNLTYYTMIEVHGSPANDVTTQTQVSIGVSTLNIIVDKEETLKQLVRSTPTITVTNSLPNGFTVGEQVLNLGGSTVVAQAEG